MIFTDNRNMNPFGSTVRINVPAKDYTSFRIGGPMAYFAEPGSVEELSSLLSAAEKIGCPVYVIGNGSNLLISDKGVDALFIRIGSNFADYSINGTMLTADAGALLSVVAKESVNAGLAGLEWASGIPGTVGGGVAMNAGAYGGEIKQVLHSVTFIRNGELITKRVEFDDLGYRKSTFAFPAAVVVSTEMELRPDDGGARERMLDYTARRREKQPLEFPSAGSTFKRPAGNYAGALIEQAGLKGTRIGGAMVSPKHAGFIVNVGNASFDDVAGLIELVKEKVFENSGIMLDPEVKIIR